MSEMIERVGRAMANADGEDYMEDHARYDLRAKAAIEAMREPTNEMAMAGFQEMDSSPTPHEAEDAWRAMIAEALA